MEKGRGAGRSSFDSEVMVKLTRDLDILSSKLSDIRGNSTATTTSGTAGQKQAIAVVSSSFVSGIRKATELGGNPGDDRLSGIEKDSNRRCIDFSHKRGFNVVTNPLTHHR